MTPPALFDMRTLVGADWAVLGLKGEVDLATAPYLAAILDAVIGAGLHRVTVDMQSLHFLDGRGLGVLAAAQHRLGPTRELVVACPPPLVRRLLAITGLDAVLVVEDRPAPELQS